MVLIVLSVIFVLSINIIITQYFHRDPLSTTVLPLIKMNLPPRFRNLNEESLELIYEARQRDLGTIRQISVLSFVPLAILSFAGGYLISDQMLRPLKKLNKSIREITSENLSRKIQFTDTGDEISMLIQNFNRMITRLDRAFESQRQFVENASHELKTPLAIIQTNLESALCDGKVTRKEMMNLIETANNSSIFMNKLIEDLLLLSLLDREMKRSPVNIRKVLTNAIAQLSPIAKEKKIRIETAGFPKKPIVINGNNVLLQRAFMNIVENSIKYSPPSSRIVVRVTIDCSHVNIDVGDSGPGIPRKFQKEIFSRFFRIDKSRSRKTGGTGLGLAITKEIIELHGGTVAVLSTKKGSTFRITLQT